MYWTSSQCRTDHPKCGPWSFCLGAVCNAAQNPCTVYMRLFLYWGKTSELKPACARVPHSSRSDFASNSPRRGALVQSARKLTQTGHRNQFPLLVGAASGRECHFMCQTRLDFIQR